MNGFDSVRIHADAVSADGVNRKVNRWLEEGALAELGIQFVPTQKLKHLSQVLFRCFA